MQICAHVCVTFLILLRLNKITNCMRLSGINFMFKHSFNQVLNKVDR